MEHADDYFVLVVYLVFIVSALGLAGYLADKLEKRRPKIRIWRQR